MVLCLENVLLVTFVSLYTHTSVLFSFQYVLMVVGVITGYLFVFLFFFCC